MVFEESPVEKTWEHAGLKCEVVFVRNSHRCGYVGVPKGHLAYGVEYDNIHVDVHGDLTYSEGRKEDGLWWLGFDCAHAGDKTLGDHWITDEQEHFWTLDEVAKETENLAEQLANLKESQTLSYAIREFLKNTPVSKIEQLKKEIDEGSVALVGHEG